MPITYAFALDRNENPVHIYEADPAGHYHCGCGANMVHKGQKLARKRAAHFAHPSQPTNTPCQAGDATFHNGVVNIISDGFRRLQQAGKPYLIVIPCALCGHRAGIPIGRPYHSVQAEAIDAVAPGTRADILFTLTDGIRHESPPNAERIAVEVVHHHEPEPDTATKYGQSKTPVIYIRIGNGTCYPADNPDKLDTLRYGIIADRIENLEWRCRNIECGSVAHLGLSAPKCSSLDTVLKDRAAQLKSNNAFAEFKAFAAATAKMALEAQAAAVAHCALCGAACNEPTDELAHMAFQHNLAARRTVNSVNVTREWMRIGEPPEHDHDKWWAEQDEIVA